MVGFYGCELKPPPEGEHIITTTRSHGTKAVNDAVTACEPTSELRVGGAGHKVNIYINVLRFCLELKQILKINSKTLLF